MKEAGYVYILTNPSFKEDWVKIGKSSRPVDIRSKELDNTAVPLPFEIYATLKTVKYSEVERAVHQTIDSLTDLRIRQNREFFNITPSEALNILKRMATMLDDAEIVEYENNQPIDPETNITRVTSKHKGIISDTAEMQLMFWTELNKNAYTNDTFTKLFSLRKPSPQHWYDISIGSSSCHICLTVSRQKKEVTASLYITDGGVLYNNLLSQSHIIDESMGCEIEWRGEKKHKRILVRKYFDIDNKSSWEEAFDWLYEMSIKIYSIVKQYS
ncbi:MAG: DUF4268 domain-containing protein [Tidjanibacter sp.]|nr:DUF4268 domain-containing protein [Tidjanibacter sp.]